MKPTTKTFHRIFLPWQDEDEEVWLHERARQGWYLAHAYALGFYSFVKGEPGEYVYRLDFQNKARSELKDYFQLFQDSGWDYVGELGGWHYFRKPAGQGQSEEIFSDNSSKVAKYQRLLFYLLLPLFLLVDTAILSSDHMSLVVKVVYSAFLALFLFIMLRVWLRIRELKRTSPRQ